MLCIGTERKGLIFKLNYNLSDSLVSLFRRNHITSKVTHPALAAAIFDPASVLTNSSSAEMLSCPQMPAACWQQSVALKISAPFLLFSEVLKTTQDN